MAQFVSAGYIMAENLRKSRQDRIIDAYLHYRQEELLEFERTDDPAIHTNADGVIFIDTAVRHVNRGATEHGLRIQHGHQSKKWLEELTSLQTEKDPELVEIQVAQLILERAQSQCATCGNAWSEGREVGTDGLGQQCVQCYQKCGRTKVVEKDATNAVVIPVILRELTAPVGAHQSCQPEDILHNISGQWRKKVEKVCGRDTSRAKSVALCMAKTVVAETTPALQAIWLDQFIQFEKMNGCDEWWCDCLHLLGTAEQRSDAARDTIDEVIYGVQRKLKQGMPCKGECDNCKFKQTMLCPKCKVCTQCCGCKDEVART
jgi:hypothetical protein